MKEKVYITCKRHGPITDKKQLYFFASGQAVCKECQSIRATKWAKKNRKRVNESQKKLWDKHSAVLDDLVVKHCIVRAICDAPAEERVLYSEIPEEIVSIKRLSMILHRLRKLKDMGTKAQKKRVEEEIYTAVPVSLVDQVEDDLLRVGRKFAANALTYGSKESALIAIKALNAVVKSWYVRKKFGNTGIGFTEPSALKS